MRREYIEGHKFNSTYRKKTPTSGTLWFVRGAIDVDGIPQAYAAWGKNLSDAMSDFKTYLNPSCVCVGHSDPKKCPIHDKR